MGYTEYLKQDTTGDFYTRSVFSLLTNSSGYAEIVLPLYGKLLWVETLPSLGWAPSSNWDWYLQSLQGGHIIISKATASSALSEKERQRASDFGDDALDRLLILHGDYLFYVENAGAEKRLSVNIATDNRPML